MSRSVVTAMILLGLALPLHAVGAEAVIRGKVPDNLPAGQEVLLSVPLPKELPGEQTLAAEIRTGSGSDAVMVHAQTEPADPQAGNPARAWFYWKPPEKAAGKSIELTFRNIRTIRAIEPAYRTRIDGPRLLIQTGEDQTVLGYHHGKPFDDLKHPMTSYIHPLVGLEGETLTCVSPADHLHHRGVYWSWVRHHRKGQNIGNWWIPKNIYLEPDELTHQAGPLFARFSARHYWMDASQGKDKAERFVEEYVLGRVFETTDDSRIIDLEITLTGLDDGVAIGGTTDLNKGYGGMTFRFDGINPQMVTEGKLLEKGYYDHLRSRWVDWTGAFKGPEGKRLEQRTGAALLVHPSHPPLPEQPPEWIVRAYGPINVSWPGLDMHPLPQDKPIHLRYRIFIHRGNAEEGKVEQQYDIYAADWGWAAGQKVTADGS